MLTLGLIFVSHDASAALIADGRVVAAAHEERFDRSKHSASFPQGALSYCLNEAGITIQDVDTVGFFTNPKLYPCLALSSLRADFPASLRYLPYPFKVAATEYGLHRIFRQHYSNARNIPFKYLTHHRTHAASAFYPSPFETAAILVIDGRGEYETISIFRGEGTTIKKVFSVRYPHSIGYLYSALTKYLGFMPFADEYKVMGMAAYGTDRFSSQFDDMAFTDKAGRVRLNLRYFDHSRTYGQRRHGYTNQLVAALGPARLPEEPFAQRHFDAAFGLQRKTEELMGFCASLARRLTGEHNLCLAGGVALNCLGVEQILEGAGFEHVFVPPAPDDGGTSLGAALLAYYDAEGQGDRYPFVNTFFGPSYSDGEIRREIERTTGIRAERCEEPCVVAARFLASGKVVGWFQGRMEFGPRALGNRSILASATDPRMKDIINARIKHREEFRPFAPAVLEGHEGKYFETVEQGKLAYPYMLATARATAAAQASIPAVIHADGTSRVQVVGEQANPRFSRLIQEYFRLTRLPVILNTSFNVRGEPIVCTPRDALSSLRRSLLDCAFLGDYLVRRSV